MSLLFYSIKQLQQFKNIEEDLIKKALVILLFCGWAFTTNAQTQTKVREQKARVEKSVFSIQTGFLGIWINNEFRIFNQFALRSEVGFDVAFIPGDSYDKTIYFLAPVFVVEPRWYYNLNKRKAKSKRIDGNSGNFVSLQTSYIPDWFVISNNPYESVRRQLWITAMWGIRRNIGKHFNYEAGVGYGYRFYLKEKHSSTTEGSDWMPNILLRIGYRF